MSAPVTPGSHPHLFCFGLGYSARVLAATLLREGWKVSATCRDEDKRRALEREGIDAVVFDRERPLADAEARLAGVTDLLSSIPPDADGDPALDAHWHAIAGAGGLRWVGYLSTVGVYGDTGGEWVDEASPTEPTSERARRRVEAERRWLDLHQGAELPVHVFRLAGIYGPGRSVLDKVRAGEAQVIHKPGHLFSRIHVDDIAEVVRASMAHAHPGTIYNVCDDEPAAPGDVVAYGCSLLGAPAPEPVSFDKAAETMSEMGKSFWRDNRRVDNTRIRQELGVQLRYPNYRLGLEAVLAAEAGAAARDSA